MTGAPFTLLGLDHVVLRVRGMAELERFYCEVSAAPSSAGARISACCICVQGGP